MSLRLLVISDHHLPASRDALPRGFAPHWGFERVLDAIVAADLHGADALISTGDLVDDPTPEAYRFACELLGVTPGGNSPGPLACQRPGFGGLPTYLVPGNHDDPATWTRCLFPLAPPTVLHGLSFPIGDACFTFLDTGRDGRRGTLDDAGIDFLDTSLRSSTGPHVVVLHHHPIPVGIPWLDASLPAQLDRFERTVHDRAAAILFGHTHAHAEGTVGSVPAFGTRATGIQLAGDVTPELVVRPPGYGLLVIDERGVRYERYVVPFEGPARSERVA